MTIRNSKFKWLGFFAIAVMLSGCSDTRELLGLERQAPDEFAVYSRAPLSLPPDFTLKPPAPGTERPQDQAERAKAQRALFGRQAPQPIQNSIASPASPGLQSLLEQTGALNANPEIRQQVDRETGAFVAETESFTNDLLFWRKQEAFGTKVDAAKEAQRIRDAQALGDVIDGGETITIEKRDTAIFEGLFN